MNADRYLGFKALRDKYDDQIVNKEVPTVLVEKADLLDLLQGVLERGAIEVQFNGQLSKITPKLKSDGNRLEVTLDTIYGAEFLGHVGALFGQYCHIYLEPVTRAEAAAPALDADESAGRGDLPGQLSLGIDGPTAEPAPEGEVHQAGSERIASTCPRCGGVGYVGEGSEEACETCGGSCVVYTVPGVSLVMVDCPVCEGKGSKLDGQDYLGPCEVCHGTGKVEGEVETEDEEVDDDLYQAETEEEPAEEPVGV